MLRFRFGLLALCLGLLILGSLSAQSQPPSSPEQLIAQQKLLADRFSKLEELFLRMSEFESTTNPARAGLLQQAAKMAKEQAMTQRMASASDLLTKKQFSRAIEEQQAATESLKRLLDLLQSENRNDRLKEQRQQIEEWIRNIQKLERLQRSLRGRTENSNRPQEMELDQQSLEQQVEDLLHAMGAKPDRPPVKPANQNPNNPTPPQPNEPTKPEDQGKPEAPNHSNENPNPNQPNPPQDPNKPTQSDPQDPTNNNPPEITPDSSSPPNSPNPPKNSEPSQQPSNPNAPSQDNPPNQDPQNPTDQSQRALEKAQQRMQKAIENLNQKKNDAAIQEQKKAEEELHDAAAELERILRQLREEEVERSLIALEARLRRMLEMQLAVVRETERLSQLTGDSRDRQLEIQANKLASEEKKILLDGQRAMLLLQEEGSSTAFPEAVQQMLADIQSVVERLQNSDVGKITVSIEQEIVAALEEMIEALVAEIKKKEEEKKEKQQGGPPSSSSEQEQALVDGLAELRLIKTLQVRINKRTGILSEMLRDQNDPIGQTQDADLRKQLQELSKRQQKVQEVTREIVIKSQK